MRQLVTMVPHRLTSVRCHCQPLFLSALFPALEVRPNCFTDYHSWCCTDDSSAVLHVVMSPEVCTAHAAMPKTGDLVEFVGAIQQPEGSTRFIAASGCVRDVSWYTGLQRENGRFLLGAYVLNVLVWTQRWTQRHAEAQRTNVLKNVFMLQPGHQAGLRC